MLAAVPSIGSQLWTSELGAQLGVVSDWAPWYMMGIRSEPLPPCVFWHWYSSLVALCRPVTPIWLIACTCQQHFHIHVLALVHVIAKHTWQPHHILHANRCIPLLKGAAFNVQVEGYLTQYAGLSFMTIHGSGHYVPLFKPKQALTMISAFLTDTLNATTAMPSSDGSLGSEALFPANGTMEFSYSSFDFVVAS